jgi:chemotaxis protein methyltransferase CheR
VNPRDYEYLRKFLKERSGLVLLPDKEYLVESRVMPVARRAGLADLGELVRRMQAPEAEPLRAAVTEAMTINESFFFRDKIPFDRFRDTILPWMLKARATRRRLRIWCAAAATGQEPYSLAMILDEAAAQLAGWRVEILATDLNGDVLARARAGLYTQFDVQRGLPVQLLLRHFEQAGDYWQISPALRGMVEFRQLNLLDDFSPLGAFDVIFCRNILIYFDDPTKSSLLRRLMSVLARDGFLVLGAAETVVGLSDAFSPHPEKRGLYVQSAAVAAEPSRGRAALGGPRVA